MCLGLTVEVVGWMKVGLGQGRDSCMTRQGKHSDDQTVCIRACMHVCVRARMRVVLVLAGGGDLITLVALVALAVLEALEASATLL